MSERIFEQHTAALEAVFYRSGSEGEREKIRLAADEREASAALAEASGISDPEVLTRLADLGIRAETLAALTLIPLIEVAWADGVMEPKERTAVLAGAESSGIAPDSTSYGLLALWTLEQPPPDLVAAWSGFIAALCAELDPAERDQLRENVMGRAREVAEAAGGFLGLGSVSKQEQRVLDELAERFDAAA